MDSQEGPGMQPPDELLGEFFVGSERVVVAPCSGVFRVSEGLRAGQVVTADEELGVIRQLGAEVRVRFDKECVVADVLAAEGERVREGEPLASVRLVEFEAGPPVVSGP